MLIDSHCHIHDTDTYEFALSRVQKKHKPVASDYTPDALLARANAAGVAKLICIGTNHEDSLRAQAFAASHENVFWSYGVHPDEAEQAGDPRRAILGWPENGGPPKKSFSERKVFLGVNFRDRTPKYPRDEPACDPVAIGEIGLDYRNGTSAKEAQIHLLEQMLQLATAHDLPCIFHVREAFDDFFAVIRNFSNLKRAVVHSFSDSPDNLKKVLDAGFYVGVNGLSTFANIPLPPLSSTLLETDSPFLAPVPHRGEVDEPAFVKNVANFLAIHYQTTFDDVAKITTENAERLFGL